MKTVLVRVGLDAGCPPIRSHGPLLPDGRFELVPIPDQMSGTEQRTYGNTVGRTGRLLADYFPERHRAVAACPMHVDPEFATCTYGTPARVQRSLAALEAGDLLVFYGGLRSVTVDATPIRSVPHALYLFGYFEVVGAVRARDYEWQQLLPAFTANFHVRHPALFQQQHDDLVLVKGGSGSRLLTHAKLISGRAVDRRGVPIFVLSEEMERIFGQLPGIGSIQRAVPRWTASDCAASAAAFVRSLR